MTRPSYEADRAIHTVASYLVEGLKRKRRADLVDAELEIRDALHRFFGEVTKAAAHDRHKLASRVRWLESKVRRLTQEESHR